MLNRSRWAKKTRNTPLFFIMCCAQYIMETYVLKNNKTDKYIGIDNASGGYPYDCELTGAKIWTDKKQAKGYADIFPNKEITLHRVKVEDEPCAF